RRGRMWRPPALGRRRDPQRLPGRRAPFPVGCRWVKVGGFGAGTMGGGVAYVAALSGCEVALSDAAAPALPRAMQSIAALLAGGLKRGKLTESERAAVQSRRHTEPDLHTAGGAADVAI